ncbi:nitroreductase family protein [Aliirhizobium terrae]|uniref:nitroreductase family protein n=1 Tax=Terrirhizobium terrae TaxID=2926709 RepID=UPI002575BBF6|nr:nitroreductase family protein [Rhizobium sp. CC-CFT758]WJH41654.1 nitroreductase family protein [Rhizobium sp. CC-CFT758]
MTSSNTRTSEFPIDVFFLDRWSPRAFTDETMDRETMLTILDAAHWAPSSGNNQPWRFIYGLRGTPAFSAILDLLVPGNQRWAQNAAALMIIVSKTYRVSSSGERKEAYTHSYDTGAAWFSVICQAMKLGYHAHGMEGFDKEKAIGVLDLPDGFRVEAAAAIGRIADKSTLPEDLQEREVPSKRKQVSDFAFEGKFTGEP